jgi:hypothetical protein
MKDTPMNHAITTRAMAVLLWLLAVPPVTAEPGRPAVMIEERRVLATDGSTMATAYHKSNKIVTGGGKIFASWLDIDSNSCIASYDIEARSWAPTTILGAGQDNHAGPALAVDSRGFLYAMFGPHWKEPFRFRKSLRPHDASAWTPVSQLYAGWNLTYPALVFDSRDTLHFAFRGYRGQPDSVRRLAGSMYARMGVDGTWSPPREMARAAPSDYTARHPYAQYHETLAVGHDGTLHHAFQLFGDHPTKWTYQGVGYMRSRDGGETWEAIDGTPLEPPVLRDSPAVFVRPPCDAAGQQDPAWKIKVGNVALDPEGDPWIYTIGTLWHGRGGRWEAVDLKPVIARDFPGMLVDDGNTLGNAVFDESGTLYVSCEIQPPPGGWCEAGTQVVLLVSGDRGKTFATLPISGVDPHSACWCSNLERPTGPWLLDDAPNLIYMRSPPGRKNLTGGPPSEVVFVRLVKERD